SAIYTRSLHDALPIFDDAAEAPREGVGAVDVVGEEVGYGDLRAAALDDVVGAVVVGGEGGERDREGVADGDRAAVGVGDDQVVGAGGDGGAHLEDDGEPPAVLYGGRLQHEAGAVERHAGALLEVVA